MGPTEKDFLSLVGSKAKLWSELRNYLAAGYCRHKPELSVGKKEYDWTVRYRRAGKTLVTLMPETGGFCVLVVLGKEDDVRARALKLAVNVSSVYKTAKQYHDGRWLWIRPKSKSDLESVKRLLTLKRKTDQPWPFTDGRAQTII